MGDHDKSLMDKVKDALGMGDDEKDAHDQHGDRATDAGGATGTTGARTGTGTRGDAASGQSELRDEETTDTGRREPGG